MTDVIKMLVNDKQVLQNSKFGATAGQHSFVDEYINSGSLTAAQINNIPSHVPVITPTLINFLNMKYELFRFNGNISYLDPIPISEDDVSPEMVLLIQSIKNKSLGVLPVNAYSYNILNQFHECNTYLYVTKVENIFIYVMESRVLKTDTSVVHSYYYTIGYLQLKDNLEDDIVCFYDKDTKDATEQFLSSLLTPSNLFDKTQVFDVCPNIDDSRRYELLNYFGMSFIDVLSNIDNELKKKYSLHDMTLMHLGCPSSIILCKDGALLYHTNNNIRGIQTPTLRIISQLLYNDAINPMSGSLGVDISIYNGNENGYRIRDDLDFDTILGSLAQKDKLKNITSNKTDLTSLIKVFNFDLCISDLIKIVNKTYYDNDYLVKPFNLMGIREYNAKMLGDLGNDKDAFLMKPGVVTIFGRSAAGKTRFIEDKFTNHLVTSAISTVSLNGVNNTATRDGAAILPCKYMGTINIREPGLSYASYNAMWEALSHCIQFNEANYSNSIHDRLVPIIVIDSIRIPLLTLPGGLGKEAFAVGIIDVLDTFNQICNALGIIMIFIVNPSHISDIYYINEALNGASQANILLDGNSMTISSRVYKREKILLSLDNVSSQTVGNFNNIFAALSNAKQNNGF